MPVALTGAKVKGGDPTGKLLLPGTASQQALYAAMAKATRGEPALLAGSASADANLLVSTHARPILNRTVDSDPLHVKASDSVALAGSSAAALAIANGGEALEWQRARHPAQHRGQPDPAGAARGLQRRARRFDTHAAQANTSPNCSPSSTPASAPSSMRRATERGRETVVLVYTEFGRRVRRTHRGDGPRVGQRRPGRRHPVKGASTATRRASPIFRRELVYTTDFRSVYATMFDQVLGVDPRIPRRTFPRAARLSAGDSTHIPQLSGPESGESTRSRVEDCPTADWG